MTLNCFVLRTTHHTMSIHIEGNDPTTWIYVVHGYLQRHLRGGDSPLHLREMEVLEDELMPIMEKYLRVSEEVFQEQVEHEQQQQENLPVAA